MIESMSSAQATIHRPLWRGFLIWFVKREARSNANCGLGLILGSKLSNCESRDKIPRAFLCDLDTGVMETYHDMW